MKIALIGARGQLGTELLSELKHDVRPFGREELDITDTGHVDNALSAAKPDLVVNSAAWNLVDQAEDESEAAFAVNAFGVRNLARWCAGAGVPLVHVSTDYVFSGRLDGLMAGQTVQLPTDAGSVGHAGHPTTVTGSFGHVRFLPYRENDRPGPLSVYAASKLAGEHFLRATWEKHFIIRTCGLYGRRATRAKGNFVETMLRLGRERGQVRVVADQTCTPTAAADLARAIAALIETGAWGTYHATNDGQTTWCDLARETFRLAGLDVDVTPITTAEFGAKAARPLYSVLSCEKLASACGFRLPPWQEALDCYLGSRSPER